MGTKSGIQLTILVNSVCSEWRQFFLARFPRKANATCMHVHEYACVVCVCIGPLNIEGELTLKNHKN